MQSFDDLGARFSGMEALWAEEIEPNLGAQKKRRERNLVLLGLLAAGTGALFAAAVKWAPRDAYFSEPLAGIAVFLFTVGLGFLVADLKRGERKWIARIMDRLGLSYSPKSYGFPLSKFSQLGLIPAYDKSDIEDEISGEHAGVDFKLAEVTLKVLDKKGGSRGAIRKYVTIFDGILIRCGFQKSFAGVTRVKRDGGLLSNVFASTRDDRVRLEDPEFERVFDVFSDDQVEARYILQPAFMQRLLDLDRHLGSGNLALAFKEQEVWIALVQKGDSFQLGGLMKGYNRQSVAEFFKGLADLFHLIEELNRGAGGSLPLERAKAP